MRLGIEAGTVVPVLDGMPVWSPGHLIVENGTIVAAAPGPLPDGAFDETIRRPEAILIPGLVNAHAHSPSGLVKGTWSRLPLEIWRQYIRAAWREYSDEAIYVSAQLGVAEMLKTGCTAVLDHFYTGSSSPHMGAIHAVRAMEDAGMRGTLALTLSDASYEQTVGLDRSTLDEAARAEVDRITAMEGAQTLEDAAEFIEEVRNVSVLVEPMIGPSAPHRCTTQMLQRSLRMAEEKGVALHMHVAETRGQYLQCMKLHGLSPVARLADVGILGEQLSMAHCVWLTDADIRLVAEAAATVVHNPASNGKLGSGRMRLPEMLAAGARVALATDGSGSNDTQNMFEALRFAGAIHNGPERDYTTWPSPEQLLTAATADSAHALGMGRRIGRIAPGYSADLVFLTTESYHFAPLNDVVNQLIWCENGASVQDVMVAGRRVVRDGRLLTIDEAALYARAREIRAAMTEALRTQYEATAAIEPGLREQWLSACCTPWSPSD